MRLLSERDESPTERLRRARERWLALCDAGITLPDYLPRPERLRVERRMQAKRVVAALFLQCMRLTWAQRARRGELLQFPWPRSPRFAAVGCSQCGQSFGPGDSGFSACAEHRARTN